MRRKISSQLVAEQGRITDPFLIKVEGEDEKNLVIKWMWQIIRERYSNRSHGYEKITYRILKECQKKSFNKVIY